MHVWGVSVCFHFCLFFFSFYLCNGLIFLHDLCVCVCMYLYIYLYAPSAFACVRTYSMPVVISVCGLWNVQRGGCLPLCMRQSFCHKCQTAKQSERRGGGCDGEKDGWEQEEKGRQRGSCRSGAWIRELFQTETVCVFVCSCAMNLTSKRSAWQGSTHTQTQLLRASHSCRGVVYTFTLWKYVHAKIKASDEKWNCYRPDQQPTHRNVGS